MEREGKRHDENARKGNARCRCSRVRSDICRDGTEEIKFVSVIMNSTRNSGITKY